MNAKTLVFAHFSAINLITDMQKQVSNAIT